MNSAALRRPRMTILEFQELVSEASPHETNKATTLEREIKLGHPIRRPALYVAPAAPHQTPCVATTGGGPIRQTLDCNDFFHIQSTFFPSFLCSSVSADKFPVAGEGFICSCAPTLLRGDRRKVLVLPISLSDMCPLRRRNAVPGSALRGRVPGLAARRDASRVQLIIRRAGIP